MPDQVVQNTDEKNPLEEIGSTLANSLNKQANPLEEPANQMFESEPFFKEEEEEVKETVVATKETPVAELNEDGTPKTPVAETKTTEAAEITPEPIPEERFIGLLNEAISDSDVSLNSIDDLKAIIEENKKFKSNNEYKELSQEERARLEVGREYGDYGLYDRVMSIDTQKITPKEALWQAYQLDNPGKNPQFLEKAFEREFTKTYEEDPNDDFFKMLLEDKGQEAKDRIIGLQEDLKKLGQYSGSANTEDAAKEKDEADKKWYADVDKVLNNTDRVTYTLEDGLNINIVMDAKDKPLIQDAMDRPLEFLRSFITDENGKYDHEALCEFVLRNFYYKEALNEARKSGAAFREEKILKEKKNAVIETGKAGDLSAETKITDQLAKNFQNAFNNY